MFLQFLRRTNAGEREDLGTTNISRGQDHFLLVDELSFLQCTTTVHDNT